MATALVKIVAGGKGVNVAIMLGFGQQITQAILRYVSSILCHFIFQLSILCKAIINLGNRYLGPINFT